MATKKARDQEGRGRARSGGEPRGRSGTSGNHGNAEPRRRLSAAERRERILAAATQLIAARGYGGAPIDAIARAAGVSPPVLYDHFPSKLALYEAVLDSHFANLRAIWGGLPAGPLSAQSLAASFDTWFGYVEANPDAARILFREPAEADAATVHRAVSERSRDLALQILTGNSPSAPLFAPGPDLEMTWVVLRGVLQGLALWWVEHPDVPRDRVVDTALTALWHGYGSLFAT